jgi:hypothetical protein
MSRTTGPAYRNRVIAEIMGWEEGDVAKFIRRYVGRPAATKAIIHQVNQAERRP